MNGLKGWKIDLDPDDRPVFPPNVVMEVKALECEGICAVRVEMGRG